MLRRTLILGAGVCALPPAARAAAPVDVLYAGSLVTLMERGVGPAFQQATGFEFRGVSGGSNALANQIKGRLRRGDVFISANPKVDADLARPDHGGWVRGYITFAQSPLVIGYAPTSRFAADFKREPWWRVLQQPGLKLGRTDPKLDPKGALSVQLMERAEQVYHAPGLAARVLGDPQNPEQVRPEENLVGRLQSGQIDAGFFYSTETTDLRIPFIPLPPEVALAAHYTFALLRDGANPQGAGRFADFLLGPQGAQILRAHGRDVVRPTASGDVSAFSAEVRRDLSRA